MGRRALYYRDSHGRFTNAQGYRRKLSTKQKVALAAAGAVMVGTAAVGTHQVYRAGARKGYARGVRHGFTEGFSHGKPTRNAKGHMQAPQPKKPRKNPYRSSSVPSRRRFRAARVTVRKGGYIARINTRNAIRGVQSMSGKKIKN